MEFSDIKCRYKRIDGFDDYYITEYGDVYSTRPQGAGKAHRLHKLTPKNPGKKEKYFNIVLCNDEGEFTKSIHRLVAEYFVDGYFDGAVVNHIDGNNRNNSYDNLEWTTIADNVRKSYETSGIGARRNFLEWTLYDPYGNVIGVFFGNNHVKKYIIENGLDVRPEMLVKWGNNNGYRVTKRRIVNCNDYPNGVAAG